MDGLWTKLLKLLGKLIIVHIVESLEDKHFKEGLSS
jgi:hypothetical protein